jgi:hypothetical protein
MLAQTLDLLTLTFDHGRVVTDQVTCHHGRLGTTSTLGTSPALSPVFCLNQGAQSELAKLTTGKRPNRKILKEEFAEAAAGQQRVSVKVLQNRFRETTQAHS